jgi:hypothetical protein
LRETARWKIKALENYTAFLREQLTESHNVNTQLRDELHKVQLQGKVRQAVFGHTIYSLTCFP